MPFVHNQAPLKPDGSQYPEYPGSHLMVFDPGYLSPTPQSGQYLMIWACHARPADDEKHNLPTVYLGTKPFQFRYTTMAKANAATLAKTRGALYGQEWARLTCRENGLRYVEWGDLAELRECRRVGDNFIDVAYCPPLVSDRVQGVVLDYEVADGRTPTQTLAFLKSWVKSVPEGMSKHLYTNEVGSGGFQKSGLTGIGPDVAKLFDGVSILQQSNKRSLPAQAATFGGWRKKLFVIFDLRTNDAATSVYTKWIVERDGLLGVNLWRNGADVDAFPTQNRTAPFLTWLQ